MCGVQRLTDQTLHHMPKHVLQQPNKFYRRPFKHAGMDLEAILEDMAGVGIHNDIHQTMRGNSENLIGPHKIERMGPRRLLISSIPCPGESHA